MYGLEPFKTNVFGDGLRTAGQGIAAGITRDRKVGALDTLQDERQALAEQKNVAVDGNEIEAIDKRIAEIEALIAQQEGNQPVSLSDLGA